MKNLNHKGFVIIEFWKRLGHLFELIPPGDDDEGVRQPGAGPILL